MDADPAGSVVLGVAIDLPEPISTELRAWRERVGDPGASTIPPHVTLLPPTTVPAAELTEVNRHLADAAAVAVPFQLHLLGTGTFRPISQVVFVAVASGISYCELMEADLRSGPLQRDIDFPYHPHVTVAHDVSEAMLDVAYEGLAGYDAQFTVDGFTVFDQNTDGSWCPRRFFPFGRR